MAKFYRSVGHNEYLSALNTGLYPRETQTVEGKKVFGVYLASDPFWAAMFNAQGYMLKVLIPEVKMKYLKSRKEEPDLTDDEYLYTQPISKIFVFGEGPSDKFLK